MAVKVKWTGNAADLPHPQETNKKPTVRYVGTGEGGVTYQPSVTVKTKNSENTDLGGSTKKGDRVIGSPGGTFLGGFSYKGKSRREKTAQEQEAEKQAQMEAYEEYVRLATLDLDAQEKAIAEAKEKAAQSKPKYNIHAFGAYDTTQTDEEKNYSKLLADLNKAKSIQYDIKGRKELDALSVEQTDALGRLSEASRPQTSVMATNQANEDAAQKAKGELKASGLSDEKIRELLGYYKNIPKREKNAETYEDIQGAAEAYAETNPGLATVASVGTNIVSGIGAIGSAINRALDPNTPVDYHGGEFLPYAYTSGVRDTVSQNLEKDYGKGASFAYGVGTSMLDSAATVGLTMAGVPSWLATSTLGGAAATAAMQEAKDRGLDDDRAIWTGLLAGVAETTFEKVSLESLITMKAPTGTVRQRVLGMLKNTAKQAGIEGSEEVFTDFANLITDGIINGDLSQARQEMAAYMAEGMTEEEARNKAVGGWLKDTAVDFAAGALAGGIMGGGANALSRAGQKAETKREYAGREQELIDRSKELLPNNQEAEKLRSKMQNKLGSKRGLTGGDIEKLLQSNVDAPFVSDVDKITAAVKNQLELYGESGNTDLIASAVTKRLLRENESGKETDAFVNSKYGQRVLNELNPENFDGENRTEDDKPRALFNSEWAGKIGTKVFAPEVFSRDVGVTGAKYNAETGKLDAIVKDDAGKIKTVPAQKAELSPLQEELFDWAEDLGEAGPVLVSAYRQTQNMETYARQFHNAYEYGKAGVPMDYVNKSQAVSYLNTTQREIAYEEGTKAHQRELQGRQEKKRSGGTVDTAAQKKPAVSLRGAEVGGVKYAPVNKKSMDGRQWASVGTMKAFAQATGVNVVFYESQANERGEYEGANGFYKDGTLYLDINAGRDRVAMGETAILKTAAHEITHYIKEGSPEQYEVLKNFVVEKLTREKGISFDDLVTDKQRREPGLSYEEAVDEVVADACEMMLKDSKAVEQLARENRSLAERIRQWIRKWVRSLKAAMEGLTADRPESRAMMQYAQELQKIWDNALVDAARNGRGAVTEANDKEQFSMREPVEETRDLIALHNMTLDNLRGALKLGGLPMPSIAIVKAKSGHDQYGPISLVFRKDTIDPQLFRSNKVYGYDAWTPTAPRIEYEVNKKAADKLRELYYRMQREKGRDFAAPLYSVANTLEDELNNKGGPDKLVDTMRDDTRIMQIYLEDTGAGSVANVMRKNVTRMSEGEIEMAQALTEKLGEKTIQSISAQTGESPFSARRRWFAKYGEAVNDALTAYYEQEGIPHEEALRVVKAETTANKIKSVLLARKYLNGNAEVITEEVDREATDKAIREKVDQDSYDRWLEGLFSGVVKNSGIYNGKDYYTDSGNRRSFSATHYEVNLENIVRAMKQGEQTGTGTFFGGQAIWGVTAKDYRSIEEIKEDSGRLQKLSEEEYSQIRQQFTERLANITSEIMDKNNGNEFTASDDAASAIAETLRTKHTVKAIDKELRTYPTLRIQPDTAQKVFDLCRDISNMPTGYFEAKPQRAVGFDEAAAVVVPDNLPADLRKGLEQIGATVREYKAGDEQSRLEAVNADERVLFQQREPRLSDRAVLEWAAEMALRDKSKSWTAEDREQLERFRNRMRMLQDTQAELEALKEERKVLLAGRKVSEITGEERTELTQNKNRIDIAKGKAERYEAAVWELESKAAIKTLLRKSRSIVETEASNQARKEYREQQEEREMVNVTRRKVERNAKRLLEYMNTNTDKKHIPEALKKPIGELLESLNFYSNSARRGGYTSRADLKYYEAMQGLQAALATQRAFDDTGEGTDVFKGYLDLPAGFESLLAVHVERVKLAMEKHPLETDVVRAMSLEDLKNLDVILSVMSRSVTKMNEMFIKRRFAYVADAAEDSIITMHRLGQHQDKPGERFALWDNTLPWYAFQRFGEGGKAVFEGLQDGWDKLAFNMKTILDFRQSLISDALARKWDTETHKVELTDPDGEKVTATLTTAQLMSLRCLSKRKQALGHLLGGGIRPDAIEITNTLGDKIKKKKWNQDKQFKLTEESLGQLLKLLTPEQIKVADAMQKFMTEQGSAWGNAISMARFGYRAFTEQNYFPIETDRQDREAKTGDAKEGSLYRLQNISAVKPLVKDANNALILRGIFDVFANHTADMAKYNALVLPIIDAQKWYNYRYGEKNEAGQVSTRTVQRAMTKAYGEVANNFVIKYLQDLNGVKENGDRGDTIPKRMISNYKRAMVAANMRVAILQPTAYARASAVLDYKYLAKAFADKTGTKQVTKEMLENSGIALWKSLGFFDTDVGRSIRDQIKGKSSKIEDLVDKTMVPAEKGDEVTWARLWRACKLEVQDKQHLTGEELLKATAERFREVVYRTQVVDSTMTRSHAMRGSGTLTKMATSFMSEPTVSYNMVMESTRQIAEDAKRMGLRPAIRRNWKTAGRAYQAYIVSAVVTAIVESLYDALRDSDDDKYLDKVWKALGGEKPETVKDGILDVIFGLNGNLAGDINPIGKVPYLRDVVSILGGYSNGRMDTEAVANLKKAIDIWDEVIRLQTGDLDKATKTTYYGNMTTYGMIYPTAKALSQLTGLPGSAAMREVATAWNTTVGTMWPALKMRTYEDKKLRKAWEEYGKDSGVSYATMYRAIQDMREFESDRDAEGNAISGSLKAKYVDYIQGLGLTQAQEKAVWEAAKNSSWSDKGTPWG